MSKTNYIKTIEVMSGKKIVYSEYNDFDSNGICEMFAIVGECDEDALYGEIWYADQEGAYQIESTEAYHLNPKAYLFGESIFVAFEQYFTTDSITHLWGVKDGKPFQPPLTDKGNGIRINKYNEIELTDSKYDAMMILSDDWEVRPRDEVWVGHTYKPYYYYWDGKNFREYGALEISKDELLMIEGGSEILEYIDEATASINQIYYRNNGVIQINYQIDQHDDDNEEMVISYGYIAFRYSGNAVSLEDCEINQGSYLKAFNPSMAIFPDKFNINKWPQRNFSKE